MATPSFRTAASRLRPSAATLRLSLRSEGLRATPQRVSVLEVLAAASDHLSADDVWFALRSGGASVSRATVYRTLALLTESGYVRGVDLGQDQKCYDSNYADHPQHGHLICEECAKIVEFESDQIQKLESEIGRQLGFQIKTQRLQITGSCQEFRKLGVCTKKRG